MISAGNFKYLITIQTPIQVRDGIGGVTTTWIVKHANVPAIVQDYSGREKYHVESSREITYDKKRVEVRYMTGIKTTDRILYDGQFYDIVMIEQLGFRESTRFVMELAK